MSGNQYRIAGKSYSQAEMLTANADDEDVREWLKSAKPGDVYEQMHAERVECAANDSPALSPFLIRIGPRGAPRVEFGAMAVSAASAFMQHFDMAEVGDRVEIIAVRS